MDTSQFIKRLSYRFNIYKIKRDWEALKKHLDITSHQVALNKLSDNPCDDDWIGIQGSLLSARGDISESDFTHFNKSLKNYAPYIFDVCERISTLFPIGRMRILILRQDTCYPAHHDFERRWHIPIMAPEESFIYFRNSAQVLLNDSVLGSSHGFGFNMPDDGYLYEIAAHLNHTACNPSSNTYGGKDRVHLVFNEALR